MEPEFAIEHFILYLPVDCQTGAHFRDVFLKEIKKVRLDMQNCRGQDFDNGETMKSCHSGVQARTSTPWHFL